MGSKVPARLTGSTSLQSILQGSSSLASRIAELPEIKKPSYCFLLDVSASMEGECLREMKGGCLEAASTLLRKGLAVSAIAFESEATPIARAVRSIEEFHACVKRLETRGSTALDKALNLAHEIMSEGSGGVVHLITDGLPDNREAALREASKLKRSGIVIRCSGVTGADLAFLAQIAGGEPKPQAAVTQAQGLKALISSAAALPLPRES
jgi:uncharacterized protein YegL